MNLELYFAPGACSFVPHVALEAIRAATGQSFEPKLVKLHKGEHKTPEYLAMNPNGQVPVLVAEVWDSSDVLSQSSLFGQMLHVLVGYQDRPSGIGLVFYLVTLVTITLLMRRVAAGQPSPR